MSVTNSLALKNNKLKCLVIINDLKLRLKFVGKARSPTSDCSNLPCPQILCQ